MVGEGDASDYGYDDDMDDENYFAEEDADDDGGDSDFENFPPSLPSITRSETSAAPPTWTGGRREGLPTAQAALGKKSALGPYVLLKTIGEGEFGKVKLAYHIDNPSKQVAVKLILKENIRNPTKHAKVLREISILQTLSHPFIVKLHEVVETDQYIGMVMEYASGGELFEYILAHRYLKEKDACRFFAQLLAGVRYIHSVGIVHRDLKLENLLLDGNHNVIITDFGFANRFRSGDVDIFMQTSCGSPCYAAPELVISEGYAGEAADVWSCGVILYAMLSGFLPFDDDPENPDGDNINQLYKYILETSLEFPEHISSDAQSLLKRMLVPDPRHRAKLSEVISHKWLQPAAHILEQDQQLRKKLAPYPSASAPVENVLPQEQQPVEIQPDTKDVSPILKEEGAVVAVDASIEAPRTSSPTPPPFPPDARSQERKTTPQDLLVSDHGQHSGDRLDDDNVQFHPSPTPPPEPIEAPVPVRPADLKSDLLSLFETALSDRPLSLAPGLGFHEGRVADLVAVELSSSVVGTDENRQEFEKDISPVSTSAHRRTDARATSANSIKGVASSSASMASGSRLSFSGQSADLAEAKKITTKLKQSNGKSSLVSWLKPKPKDSTKLFEETKSTISRSRSVRSNCARKEDLPTSGDAVDDHSLSTSTIHSSTHQQYVHPSADQLIKSSKTRANPARSSISITRKKTSTHEHLDIERTNYKLPVILAQKLKFSGPIDHRAFTSRDPSGLMAELEVFLDENGFEIQSDGRQKGEMTLRVVKKQMVSSLSGSPAISVALFDQPAAHMAADSQPESHGASGRTISLPPSPSHAAASIASTDGTAKKAPSRLAQAILASLPVSFVKRLVKKRNGGQDRKMSMIGTRTGSRIEGVLISDDSKSVSNMGDSGIELPIDTAFPNPSSEGQSNESGPSSTASDLPSTGPSASPLPVTKQLVSASARDEKESTKTEPSKKNIGSAAASNAKDDFKFSVEIEPVPNHSGLHVVHFKRIRGDAWEFKRLYHKAMKDVLDKE